MKGIVLRNLLLTIIVLTLLTSPVLIGCGLSLTNTTPVEIRFTVEGGNIYQLDIYANKGQVIKGNWKSDKAVYRWWTNPSDAAFPLEIYSADAKITGVFKPTPIDPEPGFWIEGKSVEHSMGGVLRGDILINADLPYGESGYYTICFMPYPYDTQENVNITARYWLE